MKRQLLGMLILTITFAIGFLTSPIRFSSFAVGLGEHGGFTAYESTDFVKLSNTTERYETSEATKKALESHRKQFSNYIDKQEVLETGENRIVISFEAEYIAQGFCVVRKEDYKLYEICSTSLWHVLEFEKQYYKE